MKLFRKKKTGTAILKGLDEPLNIIPGTNGEITYTEAMGASLLISVGSGSGKSNANGKNITSALLKEQYGMYVLCSNPDERKAWEKYFNETDS